MMKLTFTHAAHHSRISLRIVHALFVALAHKVADPAEGDDGNDFHACSAPKSQNCKICLWIMRHSPVALAHEVTDPAKSDDGEHTSFGLRAHLAAIHKLPVCQYLQAQSCST